MSLSLVWRILYFTWIGSEVLIAVATRTRRSSGNVRDRGTMLLLWIVIFGSISAGIWFSATHGSNFPGGENRVRDVSILVLIAGLAIRWTAVLSLGKSFSANVAIHATQRVRKTGLYRWMRHPSYTGLLLCIVAAGLYTRNWISLAIIVIPATAALLYRIHVEEIALREHFGSEYIDYSHRTKRLVPGIY